MTTRLKTIAVDERTWKKLKEMREKLGTQSYNELINLLIEKWHMSEIRETLEKLDMRLSTDKVLEYVNLRRKDSR